MKIYKHIQLAGSMLLAVTLAACTADSMYPLEDSIEYTTVPVGFTCSAASNGDAESRGTLVGSGGMSSFVVSALHYPGTTTVPENFFNGQTISKSGTSWTYSPLKYWPKDGEVDFYAFAPTTIHGTMQSVTLNHGIYPDWLLRYNAKSPAIISKNEIEGATITQSAFNKANDAANHEDLLLAVKPKVQCGGTVTPTVQLNFVHAMAGLELKFDQGYHFPTDATHAIIAFAPMCTGGTIALEKTTTASTAVRWTLDETEATYYQQVTLTPAASSTGTFFLPPQNLKNFTVIIRFYQQTSDNTYTLIETKTSHKTNLTLETGKVTTITLKN